jgi:hypothetical protein
MKKMKEDGVKPFRFKEMGKIHLDITDRPSAAFLTPTRNTTNVSHYVDEQDSPSVLLPNTSMTFDMEKEKRDLIDNSKKVSFSLLPSLQRYPLNKTYDEVESR